MDEPRPGEHNRKRGLEFAAERSVARYAELIERVCLTP